MSKGGAMSKGGDATGSKTDAVEHAPKPLSQELAKAQESDDALLAFHLQITSADHAWTDDETDAAGAPFGGQDTDCGWTGRDD